MANIRDPLVVYQPSFNPSAQELDSNGLRLLYPLEAEYTIELNQAGSIHVVCMVDPDGAWKSIQLHYLVKAPVEFKGEKMPQLFRIFRIKKARSSDGQPTIEFDARHIFYDLSYVVLEDVRPENKNGQAALEWIMEHPYAPDGTSMLPVDRFEVSSDIETLSTAYYQWKTISGALIGEDNCFLNRWGGELFVDNYYFSINSVREHSEEKCFTIAYGYNLTEISETIDATDTYSRIVATDNLGHSRASSVLPSTIGLPFDKTLHAEFSYGDEVSAAAFNEDFEAYSGSIMEVQASYSVRFADIRDDDPFMALIDCEVGDTGTIIDEELGIETVQKVIKTVTNLLTGERVSTETGSVMPSFSRRQPYQNTITKEQTAAQKRIANLSQELDDLDFAITVHTPISTLGGKLLVTSDGKYILYKEA